MGNPKPHDDVEGLPKFRLIRDFYDELIGPFTILKPTPDEQKEMIWRIEQIEDTVDAEELREEVERIIYAARVDEARRCKNGDTFVRYKINDCSSDLLVRYSSEWKLLAYTFVADDPRPFDISASICDSETYDTKRWEDIIDFCWMAGHNVGMFVWLGDKCPFLGMWTFFDDSGEVFDIDLHFGLSQVFEISAAISSRESMVECVKAFLNGGFSAAEAYVGKWRALCFHDKAWKQSHGEPYNVRAELTSDYLKGLRKKNTVVVQTLDALGFRILPPCRVDSEIDPSRDWRSAAIRAFRGHKPSMRLLASFLGKSPLANYWLRKAKGLPPSTDPIPKPERKRKPRPQDKWQAMMGI